jgi:deazaflavin-dependent oxidoreductase (nitroreductase family)
MANHFLRDTYEKLMNFAHRLIFVVSGHKVLSEPFGMPVVELHTIGRRTGLPRSCYLTTPVHDANRVVLVAAKGGDDRDPDWYHNLQACPDAELVIDGARRKIHARTANGAERAQLWYRIVTTYPGYDDLQRRTSRVIPVVICEFQD